MDTSVGKLVRVYGRDWVVQPNPEEEVLLLKPLGGSDAESIGILKSLGFPDDKIEPTQFPYPSEKDIADFHSARLLYEATKLLFRNGAGPFRCFGKLSFRPRSYQIVPLIMALRQKVVRLMIADDVGIGKTIEAGLIVRELIDRGELQSFAVICLPHLCEQWQQELKEKFDLDAVIIRSGTISSLERGLPAHTSIYRHYSWQVISIDYAKTESNRNYFLQECPDFIIVDEAHTCANTSGQANNIQQQRHALLRKLSAKPGRNMLLLTATPHSGKPEEFKSLLGLLDTAFDHPSYNLEESVSIKKVAPHFVQRRRADIRAFLKETTPFSERINKDVEYELSNHYAQLFDRVIAFAREIVKQGVTTDVKQRMKYWAALGLLRGVMSSPAAGMEMLKNRAYRQNKELASQLFGDEQIFDMLQKDRDTLPTDLLEHADFSESEIRKLNGFFNDLKDLAIIKHDHKAKATLMLMQEWLKKGLHPVIFCKYIETAKYLGNLLQQELKKQFPNLALEVITGELHDEVRKEKIETLTEQSNILRLLVCTDCLSEGINLQKGFNALLHYDLPWNPNRLEQREGRIDRFGQPHPIVNTFLLYGKDNPIDGVVLKVLLRKAIEIRQQLGISVPFPEDSKSIMEAVSAAVFMNPDIAKTQATQLSFGFTNEADEAAFIVGQSYELARNKMEKLRSDFAQIKLLKDLDIEADLQQTDEALGNPAAVEKFVTGASTFLKGGIRNWKNGYKLDGTNLPASLKALIPAKKEWAISFESPTPEEFYYLGRNHPFTEQLAQTIIGGAFDHKGSKVARATIFRSRDVENKTVLTLLRVRNVLRRKKGTGEMVAEELVCWGYLGQISKETLLDPDTVKNMLYSISATQDINPAQRERFLQLEVEHIKANGTILEQLVEERTRLMVNMHTKYRKALGTDDFEVGTIVPPDVLGIYIIFPSI